MEQCLASLEGEPVNIHIIKGVKGHIGKGRAAGFSAGSSSFVSFVDPDDYVHAGAFDRAITHLNNHPEISVVCSDERKIDEDGNYLGTSKYRYKELDQLKFLAHIHHLVVARRSAIEPYIEFIANIPQRPEFCTWVKMMYDGHLFDYIDSVDYTWRFRNGSGKDTIKADPKDMEQFDFHRKEILSRS